MLTSNYNKKLIESMEGSELAEVVNSMTPNSIDKHIEKIEADICSLAIDLEYYKNEQDKSKIITLTNGNKIDYTQLIKNIETALITLNKKLAIANKLLLKKYESTRME